MLSIMLHKTDDHEAVELNFEHSLVSLSKWESVYEKAFYGKDPKTGEESLDYFKMMLISTPPQGDWIERLTVEDYAKLNTYINSKQSATWFNETGQSRPSNEIVTSELIYYWLINLNIPFQPCESWHIHRLMTLIKVCGIKQTKPKRMSKNAQAEQYRRINAERRAALGTSG